MEDVQQQQQQQQEAVLRPSFPPTVKWVQDVGPADGGHDGGQQSFGQDSGYTSYQSTTPNNTFNLSSRHGISSVTLATIDEANEIDCSMNDSYSGGAGPSSVNLTPKTAASMELLSNIHLTTPKSTAKRTRRPIPYDGSSGSASFLAPSTPERLPGGGGLSRSVSFELPETPLRTGNRSTSQPSSQLTPHKAKSGSLKRKHSTFREKLYSDGDVPATDENRPRDLNDSFDADCRRLEDISPILNLKRRKHQEDRGIEDLMRSSTPKTASSQPTFLQVESRENRPTVKRTLRKFQSFSPSKIQSNIRTLRPLVRQNAFHALERTPEKRNVHRVLAEIHPQPPAVSESTAVPLDLATLLAAPILSDSSKQLEQTVTTVPSFDDFSLTPSKANLIDPELLAETSSFATEDTAQLRHATNFSYAPTLNSILEESPVKPYLPGKLPLPKTPPSSVTKSGRKLKRLGTNGTVCSSATSCTSSPARSVRSDSVPLRHNSVTRASVSPKARRLYGAQNQRFKTVKRHCCCGREYMDILLQLGRYNSDALETLLEYLDDTDLVQVVRVSRGWKEIIRNHQKSWKRLQCYLKEMEQHKENGGISVRPRAYSLTSSLLASEPLISGTRNGHHNGCAALEETVTVPVTTDPIVPKRQPFKVCNSIDSSHVSIGNASFAHGSFVNVSMPELGRRRSSVAAGGGSSSSVIVQSPPVSPSMRKFATNQKIASHLKPSEQLRPCPRCEQPSRIILSRASKSTGSKSRSSARFSAVGARLEKSYTLPDLGTTVNATSTSEHRNNGLNNTHSSTTVHRNNNDYPEQSPDRVRKNLFNSSSDTANTTSNSSTLLCNEQRMKLRSAAATTTKSLDYSLSMHPTGGEDVLGVRDAKCDYAICSGSFCGFRFCIKCLCEYHPNTVCADLAANSPTKEEERGRPNMACSRQSRRSLQRLCRK